MCSRVILESVNDIPNPMTITEKYIQKILPYLAGAEGGIVQPKSFKGLQGHEFPCPFCSVMQRKESKKRNRCAALMPHPESFSYTFHCCRKHSADCMDSLSFPNFLNRYNPALFRQYHLEREHNGTTGKGHNLRRFQIDESGLDRQKYPGNFL